MNNRSKIIKYIKFIEQYSKLLRETQQALKDATDNYITVVANSQQTPIDEIKADPVVANWITISEKSI